MLIIILLLLTATYRNVLFALHRIVSWGSSFKHPRTQCLSIAAVAIYVAILSIRYALGLAFDGRQADEQHDGPDDPHGKM